MHAGRAVAGESRKHTKYISTQRRSFTRLYDTNQFRRRKNTAIVHISFPDHRAHSQNGTLVKSERLGGLAARSECRNRREEALTSCFFSRRFEPPHVGSYKGEGF